MMKTMTKTSIWTTLMRLRLKLRLSQSAERRHRLKRQVLAILAMPSRIQRRVRNPSLSMILSATSWASWKWTKLWTHSNRSGLSSKRKVFSKIAVLEWSLIFKTRMTRCKKKLSALGKNFKVLKLSLKMPNRPGKNLERKETTTSNTRCALMKTRLKSQTILSVSKERTRSLAKKLMKLRRNCNLQSKRNRS